MKKIYILILVLAVGAGFLLWANTKMQNRVLGQQGKKYEVKLPDSFPKDFPLDVTAAPASGDKSPSDTLEFKTNLLPTQAFAVYSDYFKNSKWQIIIERQHPLVSSLNAKSPDGSIMSIVIQLGNDRKSLVTAIYNKKK